jgi:hypothetical protein
MTRLGSILIMNDLNLEKLNGGSRGHGLRTPSPEQPEDGRSRFFRRLRRCIAHVRSPQTLKRRIHRRRTLHPPPDFANVLREDL